MTSMSCKGIAMPAPIRLLLLTLWTITFICKGIPV